MRMVALSGAGCAAVCASAADSSGSLLLVVGAPGEERFATHFQAQVEAWKTAASSVALATTVVGTDPAEGESDLDRLQKRLAAEDPEVPAPLWLVLIGHGTFDGTEARFNLRGPDLTATALGQWLKHFRRPLVVVNTAAASAPFLPRLAATNRVVVSATRSGHEQNFTRFGLYFARAISSLEADLDKDQQVSVFEAFLVAARQAAEFYKAESRLATEHALLDDNGDGLGTPADWFRGLRAVKKPPNDTPIDGLLARQLCVVPSAAEAALPADLRQRRDALERAVLLLRDRKEHLSEEDYFRQLDALALQLALLYEGE